jgi:predicted nucleic acid-binding Zn ribbon protein
MPRYSPTATHCVICGRPLRAVRQHVDTCTAKCFRTLLALQRAARAAYPRLWAHHQTRPVEG